MQKVKVRYGDRLLWGTEPPLGATALALIVALGGTESEVGVA